MLSRRQALRFFIGALCCIQGAVLLCAAPLFFSVLLQFNFYLTLCTALAVVFSAASFYYVMLVLFIFYFFCGIFLFFYSGSIGLRGLFYLFELCLFFLFIINACGLIHTLRYGHVFSIVLGELPLIDGATLVCCIQFDVLTHCCVAVVLLLTAATLTFGLEYLAREAFAYNVVVTLFSFSASIV